MRYLMIILISIFFLPGFASAQQDTLILLGSNEEMGGSAVSAYNKHAFVAAFDSIKVADYSAPPVFPSVTSYPAYLVGDIEIKDSLAYYAAYYTQAPQGDSLYIRDISNPLESEIVGSCDLYYSVGVFRLHVFDSLALVMHSTAPEICLLEIVDISDPTNPQILSINEPPPYGSMYLEMDAWKKDNYVYWVDYAFRSDPWEYLGRIIVLDITDPTDPVPIVVDTCLPSPPTAIWIKDDYAYVALSNWEEDHGGLMVLDISDPYNIDSVGFFDIPEGKAYNVYIKGKLAYVSAQDGLYVLDITNPTNPSLVTYYHTKYAPIDVFVDEPYVLVQDNSSLLLFEASFLIAGDVNWDKEVNILDVIYLINYLFADGPEPPIPNLADANADCQINISDVVYLINFLFAGGPPPVEC